MIKAFTSWIGGELDLTIGTNLFAGPAPASAQGACTQILEPMQAQFNPVYPEFEIKQVQILTRGEPGDYFGARSEAYRVCTFLLTQSTNVTIPGLVSGGETITIHSILGGAPGHLGTDDKRRHLFSGNLTVRLRKEP